MTQVITEYVGNQNTTDKPNSRWWLQDEDQIYKHVWAVVDAIDNNQTFLRSAFERFAALYSNMEYVGRSSKVFSRTSLNAFFANRLSLNVIKSCVDSAAAKIAKNKPRPLFLTSGGASSQQKRAKMLTKYMEGLFDEIKIYPKGQRAFVDSEIFGLGILKVFIEDGKIKTDRIFPEELYVDEQDAIYGEPSQIHHQKYISRDILAETFPEFKAKIFSANSFIRPDMAHRTAADQIAVRESWHLKSGVGAKDGKHTIVIDNCTLLSEGYDKDYFPFVFFRWNPRVFGFFGMGIAEELVGIQMEITKTIANIQKSIHLVGVPRIWIESGSGVNPSHITNEPAMIGRYKGAPPIFQVTPCMPPDVYQYLENLVVKAFEMTGISMLSASSRKPDGVDSAVAMREYQDIESERFQLVGQRYEDSYMDLARICVDLSKDLYEKNPGLATKVKVGKFLKELKWSEVDMKEDEYIMRVFPTSLLPTQPQGRLAKIQELVQAGFMSKEDAESLLDFPDLEGYTTLQTAAKNDIMMMIEKILDEGEYQQPEPYMNLDLALITAQSAYLNARVHSVPEERLELMRQFIDNVKDLIDQRDASMAPPPAPDLAPTSPTAVPQAAPQSEIMPMGQAAMPVA